MEQLITLVRSKGVSEKTIYATAPRPDIDALAAKCQELLDSIYALLPDDATAAGPHDTEAHRRCKKALNAFKSGITSTGKTLVEANLWSSVIQYCVVAADMNEQTPVWAEASHNKSRASVRTKLDQFALRAVTAIAKSKIDVFTSADEHLHLAESCRKKFPEIAAKLQSLERGALAERGPGPMESVDFEDPMISNTHLDIM